MVRFVLICVKLRAGRRSRTRGHAASAAQNAVRVSADVKTGALELDAYKRIVEGRLRTKSLGYLHEHHASTSCVQRRSVCFIPVRAAENFSKFERERYANCLRDLPDLICGRPSAVISDARLRNRTIDDQPYDCSRDPRSTPLPQLDQWPIRAQHRVGLRHRHFRDRLQRRRMRRLARPHQVHRWSRRVGADHGKIAA